MAEENKVRFGLSNLTIFFRGEDTEQGAPTWGQPIKIPGVTQCSRTAQVNSNDFYADNVLYWRGNADTGDEITATVIKMDDGSGNVVLSRKDANDKMTWEKLREMMNERTMVPVTILEAVKAGVTTKLEGMRAFIPASRISNSFVEDLNEWVGKTIDVTVIEADEEKKHLVLSGREAARAKEQEAKAAKIAKCEVGSVMEGTVETIKPYGAFITLDNGLSGLCHVSQISKKRIPHPSAVLKEGQKVTVKVIAKKDGKLSLSMRETSAEEVPDDQVPAYKNSDALTTTLGDLFKDLKF